MTVIAVIPALVMIAGIIMYFICTHGKAAEAGRIMFAFGLLVFLYSLAGHVVRIG